MGGGCERVLGWGGILSSVILSLIVSYHIDMVLASKTAGEGDEIWELKGAHIAGSSMGATPPPQSFYGERRRG
jgi:hypothetical protein